MPRTTSSLPQNKMSLSDAGSDADRSASSFHSAQSNDENGSSLSLQNNEQDDAFRDVENPSPDDEDSLQHSHECCEGRVANGIIKATQAMLWTPLAVLWIILVVISGAIFFFFMVGAIPLDTREQEEKWLNYSIQVLNVLFTYAAIANEPKRLQQFIRLVRIRGTVGIDWQGNTSSKIFDYIPYCHRMFIVVNLNLNCIFQYINQTFRIIYFTPELANQHVLEVNLFFALSFLCAIIAPIHQYRCEQRVRKHGRAPPGQELDPLQKFMGRVDFSYRELGVESYQYAINQLKKRMVADSWKRRKENEKDDTKTERTTTNMAESQTSLTPCSEVDLGSDEVGDESERNYESQTDNGDESRAGVEVSYNSSLV